MKKSPENQEHWTTKDGFFTMIDLLMMVIRI